MEGSVGIMTLRLEGLKICWTDTPVLHALAKLCIWMVCILPQCMQWRQQNWQRRVVCGSVCSMPGNTQQIHLMGVRSWQPLHWAFHGSEQAA